MPDASELNSGSSLFLVFLFFSFLSQYIQHFRLVCSFVSCRFLFISFLWLIVFHMSVSVFCLLFFVFCALFLSVTAATKVSVREMTLAQLTSVLGEPATCDYDESVVQRCVIHQARLSQSFPGTWGISGCIPTSQMYWTLSLHMFWMLFSFTEWEIQE